MTVHQVKYYQQSYDIFTYTEQNIASGLAMCRLLIFEPFCDTLEYLMMSA